MKCLRWWSFHKWGKWARIEESQIRGVEDHATYGVAYLYRRTCYVCGAEEHYVDKLLITTP